MSDYNREPYSLERLEHIISGLLASGHYTMTSGHLLPCLDAKLAGSHRYEFVVTRDAIHLYEDLRRVGGQLNALQSRPFKQPCPACGSSEVTVRFRRIGEAWLSAAKPTDGLTIANEAGTSLRAFSDLLWHECRCRYEWVTKANL